MALTLLPKPNALKWSRESLAWAGGLLEGEGSFQCHDKGTYKAIRVQCSMHLRDKELLFKLQELFGGSVTGPYKSSKTGQDQMMAWGLYKQDYIYAVVTALFPFLGSRRQGQVRKIISAFTANEGRKNGFNSARTEATPST
jgi:hypothetical protein